MRGKRFLLLFLILGFFFLANFSFFWEKKSFASFEEDLEIEKLKQEIEKKRSEIKALEKKSKEYQREISKLQSQAHSLKREINFFDSQLKDLNFRIEITQEKIDLLSLEIEKLNFEIEKTNQKIEKNKATLKKLLQDLYQIERESLVLVFLKNEKLSQLFSEYQHFLDLQKSLKEYLEKLKSLKEDLNFKKRELEKDKKDQSELQESLKYQKIILNQKKEERKELLRKTKNKEAVYQELLKDLEEKRREIAKEIDELEEKLREKVSFEGLPTPYKGLLLWPAKGPITQGYGATEFARTHYYSKFHNGIDIGLPIGTPIRAAYDGVVVALGNQDRFCWRGAYGKFIVIKHPNNLATLYAHLSLIKVKLGEEVKKGEIIGFSGNSGFSTGPHLHFTVYDARTFIIKESRYCGPMPFGGSINPMKYLE